MAELLLKSGAKVDASELGYTPLYIAAMNGRFNQMIGW